MDPSRNLKKNISRDTKPDSGRELTKNNLSSVQGPSEKEIRRLYRLKLNNPRISLDRKSRQALPDHETFTKGLGSISTLEKRSTVPFCAANYRNRLDQFQLARAL